MQRVTNAAPDDARCDTCGEPNRTGDSVIYVSENWCRNNGLTWSEGLKMCIWCRHTAVFGGSNWSVRRSRNRLPEVTASIKERKERREARRERVRQWAEYIKSLIPPW